MTALELEIKINMLRRRSCDLVVRAT